MRHLHTFNCNICTGTRCKIRSREMQHLRDSSNCHFFTRGRPNLRAPIIMQLLTNSSKIDATNKVLDSFGITVQELDRYPYFRLVYSKK